MVLLFGINKKEETHVPTNTTEEYATYASSNESVMTVSADGLVTAATDGIATRTITHVDGTRKQIAVLVAAEIAEYTV